MQIDQKPTFTPIKMKITLESQEEVEALLELCTNNITVASIIKDKPRSRVAQRMLGEIHTFLITK